MNKGCFTSILHIHLPYVRQAGRWPHSEDVRHEAIPEPWISLKFLSTVAHLDNLFPYVDCGLFADREQGP